MGGAAGGGYTDAVAGEVDGVPRVGNWSVWAEFNILLDPEAAAEVLGNPVLAAKTTLVTLDLTHTVLATPDVQRLLLHGPATEAGAGPTGDDSAAPPQPASKSTLRVMLVELVNFFAATYRCAPLPPCPLPSVSFCRGFLWFHLEGEKKVIAPNAHPRTRAPPPAEKYSASPRDLRCTTP